MTLTTSKTVTKAKDMIQSSHKKVYAYGNIVELHKSIGLQWETPQRLSPRKLLSLLLEQGILKELKLTSPYDDSFTRYIHGQFSPYELAVSLRKDAYISHGSAAYLHDLTEDEPNTTFVNKEQTPKPTYGSLTQEALTKAFSRKQRESNYVFKYGKASITLLSGKHTNNLGVEGKEGRMGEHVNVTGIERTLIDITVRPGYAGGVAQVLQCFAKAVGRASGEKLIRLLKKMDYLYPYHQAIGFYMQRAGFERSCWLPLQSETLTYDFFLAHGIKQEKYVREWRLFVPANF